MSGEGHHFKKFALRDCLNLTCDDLFIVWFPSLAALRDIVFLRIFSKVTLVYVFHEPFSSLRSYWGAGFGLLKTMKIALISAVNYLLVSMAHKIVLPSSAAMVAYEARYSKSKPHAQFPLMFDDEAKNVLSGGKREFVSYIGTVAEDHAFDEFLNFASWALANKKLDGYKLLIATRSVLSAETLARVRNFVDAGLMQVQHGRPLSNSEINFFYANSLVVWNAYRRSMQSGVLPKAYMFGTPVVITNANPSEFFVDGITGLKISSNYDSQELLSAINTIALNFPSFSNACRKLFLEKFFYRAFASSFVKFLLEKNN
jgi:glycosyltransferase involved in cell wall biosynthesis